MGDANAACKCCELNELARGRVANRLTEWQDDSDTVGLSVQHKRELAAARTLLHAAQNAVRGWGRNIDLYSLHHAVVGYECVYETEASQ